MKKNRKAEREDWKTGPAPAGLVRRELHLEFSQAEYDELMLGIVPEAMEDKWFIFSEGEWLHFHRSWTGQFIGKIRFGREGSTYVTRELHVIPGDPSGGILPPEPELFDTLISGLLLGRDAFSYPEGSLAGHALIGRGRSRREEVEPGMDMQPLNVEESRRKEKDDTQ